MVNTDDDDITTCCQVCGAEWLKPIGQSKSRVPILGSCRTFPESCGVPKPI